MLSSNVHTSQCGESTEPQVPAVDDPKKIIK